MQMLFQHCCRPSPSPLAPSRRAKAKVPPLPLLPLAFRAHQLVYAASATAASAVAARPALRPSTSLASSYRQLHILRRRLDVLHRLPVALIALAPAAGTGASSAMALISVRYFSVIAPRPRLAVREGTARGTCSFTTRRGRNNRCALRCSFRISARACRAHSPSSVCSSRCFWWIARVCSRSSSTVSTMQRFSNSSSSSSLPCGHEEHHRPLHP